MGSSCDHNPFPSERKSGIPEGVERPAPVKAITCLDCLIKSAANSMAVCVCAEKEIILLFHVPEYLQLFLRTAGRWHWTVEILQLYSAHARLVKTFPVRVSGNW